MGKRPVLANACASAATAAEARFRINRAIEETRRTTVVALDRAAERITAGAAAAASGRVSFVTAAEATNPPPGTSTLEGSDLVILVATSEMDPAAASAVRQLCEPARVPTFGLVVGAPLERAMAVSALRDQTAMLLASETPSDLADILSDLRA